MTCGRRHSGTALPSSNVQSSVRPTAYAQFGLGTDTGGSVRGPSTANGIVGLKPTHGLLSRDGIVPRALSFDTAGPMARSVYDVAAALGVMTGIDAADDATRKSGTVRNGLHAVPQRELRVRAGDEGPPYRQRLVFTFGDVSMVA